MSEKATLSSQVQVSEFDIATDIITHCPSVETAFPFHLEAFLFYQPPSPSLAAKCHEEFRKKLVEMSGCKVWTIREILRQMDIVELRKFVVNNCTITFSIPPINEDQIRKYDSYENSDSDSEQTANDEKQDEEPVVGRTVPRSNSLIPKGNDSIGFVSFSHGIGRTNSQGPRTNNEYGKIYGNESSEIENDAGDFLSLYERQKKYTKEYVIESLSSLTHDELIDLLLLNPSIEISTGDQITGFKYDSIPLRPLANLVFTRDQQIVTDKGVVVGRFTPEQRIPENQIMEFVWKQLGLEPKRILAPGNLEGGDFIPIGKDLALLGVGFRTNIEGAHQLMRNNWIGTDKLVLVCDERDLNQERMHLDTIFNVITRDCCICLRRVAIDDPKYVRIAKEYSRQEVNGQFKYVKTCEMKFGEWLKRNFKHILTCHNKQQSEYLLNFLNLGEKDGKMQILAINHDLKRKVDEIEEIKDKVNIEFVDFSAIQAMYGGVHCSTQVFRAPKL